MFTHKINRTYLDDSGAVQSVTGTYTGQNMVGFDGVIPKTSTDVPVPIDFPFSPLKSILIYSSVAITIKTNNATTPGQTIVLAAGQSILWGADFKEPNFFTADVTEFFISNATPNDATVKIRVLTP